MSNTYTPGSNEGPTKNAAAEARRKLEDIKARTGWKETDRGDLNNPEIKWRTGKPDFSVANLTYVLGKTRNHKEGSLEEFVETAVKRWEMEGSHKADFKQWETVNHEQYKTSANGGKVYHGVDSHAAGNYGWLLAGCPKDLYDSDNTNFEAGHHLFKSAFPDGFVLELLELYSGPPKIVFSWRHWANFTGHYKGNVGKGELMEMFGFCEILVDDKLKICDIEVFYKPDEFLQLLEGKLQPGDLKTSDAFLKNAAKSACPFASKEIEM